MSETQETPSLDSSVIIKKAMIKVGSMAFENRGAMLTDGQIDDERQFLKTSTAYLCEQNSALALKYLMVNHPNQFIKFFIISGSKPPNETFKRSQIWGEHAYAITQDINGKWFGFSPANYGIPEPNPMTAFFAGNNLTTVINYIKDIERGIYPQSEEVESLIPRLSRHEVYTLRKDGNNRLHTSVYSFFDSEINRLKQPEKHQIIKNIRKLQDVLKT